MAPYHIVEQGEHVSRIAKKYGLSDYRTIWDHGNNDELKRTRQNPNVLFPGDRLFVPDKEQRIEARPTDHRHRFVLKTHKLRLAIVVEDMYEKPVASAPAELHVEGEVRRLTTDSQGKIEQDIPSTAENARLIVKTPETPADGVVLPVKIGHLNPVDKVSGQKGRLANLGYYFGEIDETEDPDFRSAVEEFQCDHLPSPPRPNGVPAEVDGVCGPKTQAKLKEVHGC